MRLPDARERMQLYRIGTMRRQVHEIASVWKAWRALNPHAPLRVRTLYFSKSTSPLDRKVRLMKFIIELEGQVSVKVASGFWNQYRLAQCTIKKDGGPL